MPKTNDKKTEEKEKTVLMFCANEQEETEHTLDIDNNGEVVLTCGCDRFTKLPAGTDAKALKAYIEKHNEENVGQVSQASLDEKKAELLKSFK